MGCGGVGRLSPSCSIMKWDAGVVSVRSHIQRHKHTPTFTHRIQTHTDHRAQQLWQLLMNRGRSRRADLVMHLSLSLFSSIIKVTYCHFECLKNRTSRNHNMRLEMFIIPIYEEYKAAAREAGLMGEMTIMDPSQRCPPSLWMSLTMCLLIHDGLYASVFHSVPASAFYFFHIEGECLTDWFLHYALSCLPVRAPASSEWVQVKCQA